MCSRDNLFTTVGALILGLSVVPSAVEPAIATTGYSVSLDDNALYKITLETGEATKMGPVVMSGGVGARNIHFTGVIELEFTPDGRLFGLDRDRDSLIHINPFTGYVMEEFPLRGPFFGRGIDHVPQHVGLAWFDAEVGSDPLTTIDTLVMVVGGVAGETSAAYSINQNTGRTRLLAELTNGIDEPFAFPDPIMALYQQNPLSPSTSSGTPYIVQSGGQVSVGQGDPPISGSVDELGIAEIFSSNSSGDRLAWIGTPQLSTLPEGDMNVFIEDSSGDGSGTFSSTMDTSGVGNFASLAITHTIRGPITEFGDANLDGKVDAADLNVLALKWQQTLPPVIGGHWHNTDFNSDSIVDAADLNLLALKWQFGVKQPSLISAQDAFTEILTSLNAPEPGTALVGAFLCILWAGRAESRWAKDRGDTF